MAKHALFLHGTDGSPNDHWWPWLKEEFERNGCKVWAPLLPDSHRPSSNRYWYFLNAADWSFSESILVGHSSGATSVLNLLMRPNLPRVKAAVLVGAFLNENLTKGSPDFPDDSQFSELFPVSGFDWLAIKEKAEKFYFIHGDDDPYCAYEDTVAVAGKLNGKLLQIPKGGHLSGGSDITEIPQLVSMLKEDTLL